MQTGIDGEDTTSSNTFSVICNKDTDEDVAELDINDFFYWDYWMQGASSDSDSYVRDACTADSDCEPADACGEVTLGSITNLFCVPM